MNKEEACSFQQCLVCSVPITSAHLGMDICRACSSFFKRTKTTGRQYPCRTGERNCPNAACKTIPHGKFTCRRCRYDKCVLLGMEYDGPLRVRRKPGSTKAQGGIKSTNDATTRERVESNQRAWRTSENTASDKVQILTDHIKEVYDINQDTYYEISRLRSLRSLLQTELALSLAKGSQSRTELASSLAKGSLIDGYRRTYQVWGGFHKYVMCSVVTCYEIERNFEHTEKNENSSFLVSYMKSLTKDQNDIFLPLFSRCLLTDQEYYALLALVMSELDSNDVSEEAHLILDRYRQEDLQLHYQNDLGLKDYSMKLGNLMTLNHAVQECKSLFKIFWRFYTTMFDVFITEKMIKEFFL
ncbi:hypothetical protein PRIPAC_97500 [Pristionchus pacificus]|uniref:Nuclear receptor n=1 Tax=Pristionchus pacificus TaxID=54126 RepID=A0A2A6D1Z6_PRIPA|nr:hypothetical protein PRIPAC_97500 [Pristionchus pacificus]|eukprot:PDM84409.1 nuclear receptor [Pristionchus pacificus]